MKTIRVPEVPALTLNMRDKLAAYAKPLIAAVESANED